MARPHFIEFLLRPESKANDLKRRYDRAAYFYERNYPDLALAEMYGVIQRYGNRPEADATLAVIHLQRYKQTHNQFDLNQALAHALAVETSNPDDIAIKPVLGEILYHLNRTDNARFYLSDAFNNKNWCISNKFACAKAAWFLGEILHKKKNFTKAARYYKSAISDPEHGRRASYMYAITLVESGQIEEAVPLLEDLLNDKTYKNNANRILERIYSKTTKPGKDR